MIFGDPAAADIVLTCGADILAMGLNVTHQVGVSDIKKGVPSAESSRSVRGLGKGVSGKPYPRLCNARRPRLEPGTFRSQANVRLDDFGCMGQCWILGCCLLTRGSWKHPIEICKGFLLLKRCACVAWMHIFLKMKKVA
ncbi:uncharacterized protein [Miscanthus floridulus]|uniref:uncharacterized protein isoform X1 n=1 Tax=Miscanthus floridulus TaxID=154761 RepID=UPI00345853DE